MTELHESTPRQIDEALVIALRQIADIKYAIDRAVYGLCVGYHNTLNSVSWWEKTDGYARQGKDTFIVLATDAKASAITITHANGYTTEGWEDYRTHRLHDECYAVLKPKALTQSDIYAHCQEHGTEAHRKVVALMDDLKVYKDLVSSYNDEYNRRPWSRYWLVTSSKGHIHASTGCSTCNKGREATSFALVPMLSGERTASAVEVFGSALCSVCYPEAPTDEVGGWLTTSLTRAYEEGGYEAFLVAKAKAEARKK